MLLSCEQMFDVVNDVRAYPEFLPWCHGARVLEESDQLMVAALSIRKAGISAEFTTRNRLHRPDKIDLALVDGPFRTLEGRWRFTPLGEDGCKTEMSLRFDFSSRMLDMTLGRIFEQVADTMVDAFCRRAEQQYANG